MGAVWEQILKSGSADAPSRGKCTSVHSSSILAIRPVLGGAISPLGRTGSIMVCITLASDCCGLVSDSF